MLKDIKSYVGIQEVRYLGGNTGDAEVLKIMMWEMYECERV